MMLSDRPNAPARSPNHEHVVRQTPRDHASRTYNRTRSNRDARKKLGAHSKTRGAGSGTTDSQQSVVPEPGEIRQAFLKMLNGYCSNHRQERQLRRNHGLSENRTLAVVTAAS